MENKNTQNELAKKRSIEPECTPELEAWLPEEDLALDYEIALDVHQKMAKINLVD